MVNCAIRLADGLLGALAALSAFFAARTGRFFNFSFPAFQYREAHGKQDIMSLDEIVNGIIRLLRARDELGGHFQQEPYKGDFFRLFVAAFDAGLLKQSALKSLKLDSLFSIIGSRDPDVFQGKTWPMFSAAWPEWDYAWSQTKRAAPVDDDPPGG